ncbi:hypothetical protein J6590_077402, partial [Homalodisca vitripennis]
KPVTKSVVGRTPPTYEDRLSKQGSDEEDHNSRPRYQNLSRHADLPGRLRTPEQKRRISVSYAVGESESQRIKNSFERGSGVELQETAWREGEDHFGRNGHLRGSRPIEFLVPAKISN